MRKLPKPECKYGYTEGQIKQITGDRYVEFCRWMYGQTMSVCDNKEYDYAEKAYKPTGCGPHGSITYASDLTRFMNGLPVVD